MIIRKYENYEDYTTFQKIKTNDPIRRKKWLNEEWDLKLNGFKYEFAKLMHPEHGILKKDHSALCLGARTGQEVQAMIDLGIDAKGIDLVPCEPLVQEGDIHDLSFDNNSFDFVFTNIIDHTINPQKMIDEVERVLKPEGHFFLQMQAGLNQDEFTEYQPQNSDEIVNFFNNSTCIHANWIGEKQNQINAHGMNFEMVFRKNKN